MIGPDYEDPSIPTPDQWNAKLVGSDGSSERDALKAWWEGYNDPSLTRLVELAEKSNKDLAIAGERLVQAQASRKISRSLLFPSVDGSGSATRSLASENTGLPGGGETSESWLTGFDVGWELDLWGSNRRRLQAAAASEEVAAEVLRDTLVSLRAEVAITYIELRTIDERMSITRRNLATQEESLELADKRFSAGVVPELDVQQAKANRANTAAALPRFRQQRAAALNRLAVLVGAYPQEIESSISANGKIPSPANKVATGLPADLLRMRPDVRAAERRLAAANAEIGVAKGDLYPRFSLGGTFALQAMDSDSLFDSASRSYGFGPSFRWNLFSAGRVRNQVRVEKSQTREALLAYEHTVLQAVAEVENAMVEIREERARIDQLNAAVAAARKSRELIAANYGDGLLPFQNVLDAERVQLQSEDSLVESQGRLAAAYARLYKALGGSTSDDLTKEEE